MLRQLAKKRQPKNKILIAGFVFALCFTLMTVPAFSADQNKQKLQIFMGGEQYGSFDEYRAQKLKRQFLDSLDKSEIELFQQFMKESQGIPDVLKEKSLSLLQLKESYQEFRESYRNKSPEPVIQQPVNDQMDEMGTILEQIKSQNTDVQDLTIDPDKMKTIIIDP